LHPAAKSASLIRLDIRVNPRSDFQFFAPHLVGSAKLFQLTLRNLEVILMYDRFVVEKECHGGVEIKVVSFFFEIKTKKSNKNFKNTSDNFQVLDTGVD
jgi:hypothetical protein